MLVATDEATNILTNSADLPGQIIDLGEGATQYGHYYGKASNTTADHTALGTPNSLTGFMSQVTNLEAGTKYYFKAYLTDGQETVYGKEKTFTTLAASAPTLTTTAITLITLTGAVSGGNITSDGGAPITAKGVCWNSFTGPTTSNNKTVDGTGTGTFTSTLSGLTAGSTYFVRAYATNSAGTTYGNELTFTTTAASVPTITTYIISNIHYNSANGGGDIISDGGSPILTRGVCWSTSSGPTITNSKTTDGSGTGSFASEISGLSPTTKYYVRAYATNLIGTAYGSEVSFTTSEAPVQLPILTTVSPTNITSISATTGGVISSDGGSAITQRGVCWNGTGGATLGENQTVDGSGTGTFASNLAGLAPNTKYYVRAYAVNAVGTAYGNEVTFTTNSLTLVVPALTTTAVTGITSTSASSGGNITSNGGATVTASGVCWSTTPNPVASGNHSTDGSATGTFTSSITGLNYNTVYYVRAYATNSTGTGYGSEVQFKTLCIVPTVTTVAATNIGTTTATINGTINANNLSTIPLFKYGTSTSYSSTINSNPYSVDGTTNVPVSVDIINLTPGTLYHFVVLAGACGTEIYGTDLTFTTLLPTPTITNFSDIIKNFGDPPFTLTPPTSNSSGSFTYVSSNASVATISGSTVTITGLGTSTISATQAATASYTSGTVSAALVVNATKPSLSTNPIAAITSTSAISGGNITSNGGATITASGVCWSTTATPVVTGSHTTDGATTGSFVSSITGLTLGQTYYVRAYATNSAGTGYGNEISFTAALAIGESYQGGILAYILQSTDPGWVAGQTRGIIVAPTDQSPAAEWGCYSTIITGADGTFMGTGNQNTTDIVAGCSTAGIAARICNDLVLGGFSDWYLPSEQELNKLYLNRIAIGGLNGSYWSSTETNSDFAIYQDFTSGLLPNHYKYTTYKVRAIRAFPAAPVAPVVTTTAASAVTATTATSGGNVLADGGSDITARGVCWGITSGPTIAGSKTTNSTGTGIFSSNITGLSLGVTYYVRAYATNSVGTVYGNEVSFIAADPSTASDASGNSYNVIRIGTQLWLRENLKTTKYNDNSSIPNETSDAAWGLLNTGAYCDYNNLTANSDTYGRLYNWFAVNTGKLCPTGWHVPTDAEWNILTTYVGGLSIAGEKLKEAGTTHWAAGNTGTNSFGFTALPAGFRQIDGTFQVQTQFGLFWAHDSFDTTEAWDVYVQYNQISAVRNSNNKKIGFSVRCIID